MDLKGPEIEGGAEFPPRGARSVSKHVGPLQLLPSTRAEGASGSSLGPPRGVLVEILPSLRFTPLPSPPPLFCAAARAHLVAQSGPGFLPQARLCSGASVLLTLGHTDGSSYFLPKNRARAEYKTICPDTLRKAPAKFGKQIAPALASASRESGRAISLHEAVRVGSDRVGLGNRSGGPRRSQTLGF